MFGVNSSSTVQSGFSVLDTGTWEWRNEYLSSYSNDSVNGGTENSGSDSGGPNSSNGISSGGIVGIVLGCVLGVVRYYVLLCSLKTNERKLYVSY